MGQPSSLELAWDGVEEGGGGQGSTSWTGAPPLSPSTIHCETMSVVPPTPTATAILGAIRSTAAALTAKSLITVSPHVHLLLPPPTDEHPDQRCRHQHLPHHHGLPRMVPRAHVLAGRHPTPPPLLVPHRRAQLHLDPLPPQLPLRPPRSVPPPDVPRSLLDSPLPPSLFLPLPTPHHSSHDLWHVRQQSSESREPGADYDAYGEGSSYYGTHRQDWRER